MRRLTLLIALATLGVPSTLPIIAQSDSSEGSVLEFTGTPGELIVSRDGVIYYLVTGDALFQDDILRSRDAGTTEIIFRGCTYELPAAKDVELGDEFCVALIDEPSMATIASQENVFVPLSELEASRNAPLVVGGVVLSYGGLSALTGQLERSSASDPIVATSESNSGGSNSSSP